MPIFVQYEKSYQMNKRFVEIDNGFVFQKDLVYYLTKTFDQNGYFIEVNFQKTCRRDNLSVNRILF